jgi:hypothetical protein
MYMIRRIVTSRLGLSSIGIAILISPLHGSMAAAGCPVAEARVLIQPVDPFHGHREAP